MLSLSFCKMSKTAPGYPGETVYIGVYLGETLMTKPFSSQRIGMVLDADKRKYLLVITSVLKNHPDVFRTLSLRWEKHKFVGFFN